MGNTTNKAMILWIGYVFATTLAGLLIHPYKSTRKMVFREQMLLPIVLTPFVAILALFVLGRVGSIFLETEGLFRELIAASLGCTLIGLLLWQGLLIALVVRFARAK